MLFDVLLDPSWSGYKQFTPLGELNSLQLKLVSTYCHKRLKVQSARDFAELLVDLLCQLSGWDYYEGVGAIFKSLHVEAGERQQKMNNGKQVGESLAFSCWSDCHQVTLTHSYWNCLHLNRLRLQKRKIEQIFNQFRIDFRKFLPIPNGIRSLPSPNVYFVVLSEDPPIPVIHLLKGFGSPVFKAIELQNILALIICLYDGDETFGCIFAFIPFEEELTSILNISSLRNFCLRQTKHSTLHFIPFLQFVSAQFVIFGIPRSFSWLNILFFFHPHEMLTEVHLLLFTGRLALLVLGIRVCQSD